MNRFFFAILLASSAACGGVAVNDDGGDGQGAGGGSTSATTKGSTSTGPGGVTTGGTCSSHEQCPPDSVCIFSSGTCARACGDFCDACTPGTACDGCATSSCPKCDDCRPACVPVEQGRCDDDDPCLPGWVCLFPEGVCAPSCQNGACADPNVVCSMCVTSSCCGCKDCVGACIPPVP